MPEGPEIRRAADALARVLVGMPLVGIAYRLPALRRAARTLHGLRVTRVYACSKALLIEFSCGLTHYSHNQLYGEWVIRRAGRSCDDARQVRVELATERHVATLYSATEIALLDADGLSAHPYLRRLGPDVLPLARALRERGVDFEDYRFLVYGREGAPCWTCGRRIRRIESAGRGLYFCPSCQGRTPARA